MKLLLDENLLRRIVPFLQAAFPGSTQDVRDFAAQQGVDAQAALSKGTEQKAAEFVQQGASIYRKA